MKYLVYNLVILAVISGSIRQVGATPILNPANGNYYELFTEQVDWPTAKAAVETLTYIGLQGHLATITSQQENDFISATFGSYSPEFWLGGFQPAGSPEPAGNWQWITGEPFVYTNWYPTEPNDAGGNENEPYLEIRIHLDSKWNDNDRLQQRAYLAEWDTVVPEPSTILLLTTGLAGIGAYSFRRKRKKT